MWQDRRGVVHLLRALSLRPRNILAKLDKSTHAVSTGEVCRNPLGLALEGKVTCEIPDIQ